MWKSIYMNLMWFYEKLFMWNFCECVICENLVKMCEIFMWNYMNRFMWKLFNVKLIWSLCEF